MNSVAPYTSTLRSSAETSLVGPYIGIRAQTSGQPVRFGGETGVGFMVNNESLLFQGNGFGEGFAPGFMQNSPFSASASSTHFSPVFRVTLNVEVDVVRFLPFLSRIPLLNAARARVGYFLFVAGQISRPTDTILWQGQPLAPAVATDRTTWNMDGFSAGLVWED